MGTGYIQRLASAVGNYYGRRRTISHVGFGSTLSDGIEAALSSPTWVGRRLNLPRALKRADVLLTGNPFGAYTSRVDLRSALETFTNDCNAQGGASLFFWLGDLCSRLKIVRDSGSTKTMEVQCFYTLDSAARKKCEQLGIAIKDAKSFEVKELIDAITQPLEPPIAGITSLMSDREQRDEIRDYMVGELGGSLRNLDPFRADEARTALGSAIREKIEEIRNPVYVPESLLIVMFALADLDELITGERFVQYDSSKKLDVLLDRVTEFAASVNSTNPFSRLMLDLSDTENSILTIETKRGQDVDCVISFDLKSKDEVCKRKFLSLKETELRDLPFESGYQLNSLHLKPIERLLE